MLDGDMMGSSKNYLTSKLLFKTSIGLACFGILTCCIQETPIKATFGIELAPIPLNIQKTGATPIPSMPSPLLNISNGVDGNGSYQNPPTSSPTYVSNGGSSSGGGSSGGGGTSALEPSGTAIDVTGLTYSIQRVAGASIGGLLLDSNPLLTEYREIDGIATSPDGTIFVSDSIDNQVRAISSTGETIILAGSSNGEMGYLGENIPSNASLLNSPAGIIYIQSIGALLIADSGNHRIRYFIPGGRIYTLAGGGSNNADNVSVSVDAKIGEPIGLANDTAGNIYFSEGDTGKIRRIGINGNLSTTAILSNTHGGSLAARLSDGTLWAANGDQVVKVDPTSTSSSVYTWPNHSINGITYDQNGSLFVSVSNAVDLGTISEQIWRLQLDAAGSMAPNTVPELIAGSSKTPHTESDYSISTSAVEDASSQSIGGSGSTALCIDLSHADDANFLSGQIYGGSSYISSISLNKWGQVFRLSL